MVVFDTRIPIQLAFYALVEHGEFCFLMLFSFWYIIVVGGGVWRVLLVDLCVVVIVCVRALIFIIHCQDRGRLVV